MYPYEGMFLVDPVKHGEDAEGVEGTVKGLLEKHGAKIEQFEKWDERRLAYEIKGHKRGVYLLAHFHMPGESIAPLREDCKLTEGILREMLVRLDSDIPTYLERSAAYYEKMKIQEHEVRRDRDDEGDHRSHHRD